MNITTRDVIIYAGDATRGELTSEYSVNWVWVRVRVQVVRVRVRVRVRPLVRKRATIRYPRYLTFPLTLITKKFKVPLAYIITLRPERESAMPILVDPPGHGLGLKPGPRASTKEYSKST